MTSLNDLPDELLVAILSYLQDFDSTKIRLERVSKRFFRCLRESWKSSEQRLDLEEWNPLETPQLVAMLRRMPKLSFLDLHKPELFQPELFDEFFNQQDKLELLELRYFGDNIDGNTARNEQLLELCLAKSAPTLTSLDMNCVESIDAIRFGPLIVCMKYLPQCKKLEVLRLQEVYANKEMIVSALKTTKLKSLELCDVSDSIQTDDLIEMLNTIQTIQSLNVVFDSKFYEEMFEIDGEDTQDENLIVLPQLCDSLNQSAAQNLKSIELTIMNIGYMQYIGNIFNKLPNLQSLCVDLHWFQQTRANDVVDLMGAIEMLMENATQRPQPITLVLRIAREKQGEIDFGRNLWYALNEMQAECLTSKRDRDFAKWKQQIRKDNVNVKFKVRFTDVCQCCNE